MTMTSLEVEAWVSMARDGSLAFALVSNDYLGVLRRRMNRLAKVQP